MPSKNDGTLQGWSYVSLNTLNPPNTTNWVRMHLLPDFLGGKATDSNLVVALSTTNSKFYREVENPAQEALQNGQEDMIWYEVDRPQHPHESRRIP